MNLNPDIWDLKFKKEGWTFAFGSMMQSYGQMLSTNPINKPTSIEEFSENSYKLYQLAKKMCAESVEENLIEKQKVAGNPDDIDIPV